MRHITTKTLFFIILASSGLAKGQDYLPLVKDNTEWNVLWKNLSPNFCITESLQINGDTLVDDIQYKKVMRMLSSQGPYHWPGNTEEHELYGLIREDLEGKVFYQPIDQDTVYLLYDFGMNVNDTVLMRYIQSPNPLADVVVRIDSISTQHIAGVERRVFYVSSRSAGAYEWYWTNTWIEGIGAIEGLLYSCNCTDCGGGLFQELLCYHENGEVLYMNSGYEDCIIDTYITKVTEHITPSVYYDSNSQKLRFLDLSTTAISLTIYDMLGRMVFRKPILVDNIIDLSAFPKGVYLIRYQTSNTNSSSIIKIIK